MRPVDNFFGSAVGAFVDQRCRVLSRGGVCSGVAIHPVGDLSAIAGTTSNAGERGHGTVFGAGVRGDCSYPDGSVPSVERQRAVNGHGRRTRRRPWRSARVSLAVLRGFRPPEGPGTEPFSERVRPLCESPLLELARGTRAVAMIRSSKNGSPPPPAWCACAARIACSARTCGRLRTPCSNSPASRVPAEVADRGGIQGPDSPFPSGVTPPALRA